MGERSASRRYGRLDDTRLAALVREGDARAFEALYDRHQASLLAFCRHMLGSLHDGEDALQQTFLRAHKALSNGPAPDAMRPWLFAIARNRCRTLLAARRESAQLPEDFEPGFDGLAEDVGRRADLRELVHDLSRLPDDQREALVLFELGGSSHADIAQVLACPPAKVKALVFQARSTLIAERDARSTPCEAIREQLAVARGGVLRRGPLRRHLRQCAPCDAYRLAVAGQRDGLASLLPVIPTRGPQGSGARRSRPVGRRRDRGRGRRRWRRLAAGRRGGRRRQCRDGGRPRGHCARGQGGRDRGGRRCGRVGRGRSGGFSATAVSRPRSGSATRRRRAPPSPAGRRRPLLPSRAPGYRSARAATESARQHAAASRGADARDPPSPGPRRRAPAPPPRGAPAAAHRRAGAEAGDPDRGASRGAAASPAGGRWPAHRSPTPLWPGASSARPGPPPTGPPAHSPRPPSHGDTDTDVDANTRGPDTRRDRDACPRLHSLAARRRRGSGDSRRKRFTQPIDRAQSGTGAAGDVSFLGRGRRLSHRRSGCRSDARPSRSLRPIGVA